MELYLSLFGKEKGLTNREKECFSLSIPKLLLFYTIKKHEISISKIKSYLSEVNLRLHEKIRIINHLLDRDKQTQIIYVINHARDQSRTFSITWEKKA